MNDYWSGREVLPRFIAVEGLDGAGTTTQSELLAAGLRAAGHEAVLSMEPTGGPVGTLIRQVLRGRLTAGRTAEETDRWLAHLFAADRQDHLGNPVDGIRRQLAQGLTVLTTRYYFSSYAYNARTQEQRGFIHRLNADFPLPEVLVYVHVPLEVALARLQKRDVREYYEKEEELRRVAAAFEELLAPLGARVVRADATLPPQETAAQVLAGVLPLLTRLA